MRKEKTMGKFKKVVSGIIAFVIAFTVIFAGFAPSIVKADGYDTGIPEIRGVTVETVNANEDGSLTTASSIRVTVDAWDDVQLENVNLNFSVMSENGVVSKYVGGAWYHQSYQENAGWSVDGEDCTYEFSLAQCDYNGYVYISSLWVNDASGNTAHYDGAEINQKYRLLGTNTVTNDSGASVLQDFEITEAGAYDANGTSYTTGNVITENTTVTYKVTTAENLQTEYLILNLATSAAGTSSYKNVQLDREAGTNTYSGSLTFTSDMYPTSWAASSVSASVSLDGTTTYYNHSFYGSNGVRIPTVILKVGSQVVNPTMKLTVNSMTYDFSNGYLSEKSRYIINNQPVARYAKLSEVVELPTAPKIIDGVETKWYVYQHVYDSNTKKMKAVYLGTADDYYLNDDSYLSLSLFVVAMPEGYYPVSIRYAYKGDDGRLYNEYAAEWVKASSEEEAYKQMTSKYQDDLKTVFSDAEFYQGEVLEPGLVDIRYSTEKVIIQYTGRYVRDFNYGTAFDFVDFGTKEYTRTSLPSNDEMRAFVSGQPAPEYKANGIEFQNWTASSDDELSWSLNGIEQGGLYDITVGYAAYDKDVVVSTFYYYQEGSYDNEVGTSFDYYTAGKTDDEIAADMKNRTVGGYTNWKLDYTYSEYGGRFFNFMTNGDKSSNSITTSNGATINFEASEPKTETKTLSDGRAYVESAVAFDRSSTKTVEGTTSLTSEAISTVVDLVKNTIDKAKEATGDVATSKVKVNMADATVVPTEILEAAKGQDIDVEFVMTGDDGREYSWTVNGNSITGKDLKNVNLKTDTTKANVPSSVISDSKADGMPNIQLNLADHGLFGFTANLKMYVGTDYAGKYANLMYYTDGRLEIQNSSLIDGEGYATLSFTHASDYIIAMGDDLLKEDTPEKPAEDTPKPSQNPQAPGSTTPSVAAPAAKTPITGDSTNVVFYVVIFILGMSAVAGVGYKRKRA